MAGIGGATIAEAKERLSYEEVMTWFEYIKKHGPLDLYGRLEYGFALVAHQTHQAFGGKARFEAFMPYLGKQDVVPQAANDEDQAQAIMMMLASLSKGKK